MTAIFLFHNDLRIRDNTGWNEAMKASMKVIPVFIFPPEQIDTGKNAYFSNPAVQFMCESLEDLNNDLKRSHSQLHMFQGDNLQVLEELRAKHGITALFCNTGESVYAKQRDKEILHWCKRHGVSFHTSVDDALTKYEEARLPDGRAYSILAQYYRRIMADVVIPKPRTVRTSTLLVIDGGLKFSEVTRLYTRNSKVALGGRKAGLSGLQKLSQHKQYSVERNYPANVRGTTRMSAHLRFGTVSIREMYWELVKNFGKDNAIIRELIFRDFYRKLYVDRPELQRGVAYKHALDSRIPWRSSTSRAGKPLWNAWTTGTTGIPMVDAGMRQLLHEGWCHNRARMIVASVATRHMRLDWRECARFFYKHLVDADPISNTAGWQWAAGVGVDSAPFFRSPFNPFRQSLRFDKDGVYIRRWIPELQHVPSRDLHHWDDPRVRAKYVMTGYPAPVLDVALAAKDSTMLYKNIMHKM